MKPKKTYDKQKTYNQYFIGVLIIFFGMFIAYILDNYILEKPDPDLINIIVLISVVIGLPIAGPAFFIILRRKPFRPLHHSDKDFSTIYQQNMLKLKKWRALGAFFIMIGILGFLYLLYIKHSLFFVMFFIAFIGVIVFNVASGILGKCPACKDLPTDGRNIILNLKRCPNCDAYLG